MSRRIVSKVTLTGPGDDTSLHELRSISCQYPFVEFGVLLSKRLMGRSPRFPSRAWLTALYEWQLHYHNPGMSLAGHLCGRWVRDVCAGEWTFLDDLGPVSQEFHRLQLNFHAEVHRLNREKFLAGFVHELGEAYTIRHRQIIFQLDDVNNEILAVAQDAGVDAVPLFDLSGGAGVLPKTWPVANGFCGYAGGLSPENVQEQLEVIERVVGDGPIWIDAETHVRSDNDKTFDLDKVRRFLEAVSPWVVEQATERSEG